MKLIVFDLDGTLNDTSLYVIPATRRALAQLGAGEISDEEILRHVGATWQEACESYLPGRGEAVHQQYTALYSAAEREIASQCHGSFPGVPQMLHSLHSAGYQTAICSNASLRYITMMAGLLGIVEDIDLFAPLEPGMTSKNQSLHKLLSVAQPEKAVMVGDRKYDLAAAQANSIPFIGCYYGFTHPGELDGCDESVNSPGEIPAAVARLIGQPH